MTSPAALFRRAAIALYGDEFVAPLARALGVEKSTVRKMADGKSRVMPGMWRELANALTDRARECQTADAEIWKLLVAEQHAAHPPKLTGPDS